MGLYNRERWIQVQEICTKAKKVTVTQNSAEDLPEWLLMPNKGCTAPLEGGRTQVPIGQPSPSVSYPQPPQNPQPTSSPLLKDRQAEKVKRKRRKLCAGDFLLPFYHLHRTNTNHNFFPLEITSHAR